VLLIVLTFASHGMQILNPIFLQELLGYTATQAGLAMAPRGLGVMISMFFVGSIARHNFKTRPLVIVGILSLALGTWNLASLINLSMSIYNFAWATFIQGIGMGLVFPDISTTALGSVSREEMGHVASIFSMTRNIGGSIGTSVLTTMLIRRGQVRQGYLVGPISVFDAWRVSEAPVHMPGRDSLRLSTSVSHRSEARVAAFLFASAKSSHDACAERHLWPRLRRSTRIYPAMPTASGACAAPARERDGTLEEICIRCFPRRPYQRPAAACELSAITPHVVDPRCHSPVAQGFIRVLVGNRRWPLNRAGVRLKRGAGAG
jgi:MFS family permease